MRSVSRLVDVSINTVTRELVLAGQACADFHDRTVRDVKSKHIQCDEIWSFCGMKEKQAKAKADRPENVGDTWTWTALDADSKLIISWFIGARDAQAARVFMNDAAARLANRVQLTTDGHRAYLYAVAEAFGVGFLKDPIDYAMLVKLYGVAPSGPETRYSPAICFGAKHEVVRGNPDPAHISTSYVKRSNLTMRMHMRRFTRLTNAFSKKFENHCHMVALYAVWYNFVRIHKTLRCTSAMEAGVADRLYSLEDVVGIVDEWEAREKAENPN